MKVSFIRNVLPGSKIIEQGTMSFGIHNNISVLAGQLCKIEDTYFIRTRTTKYCPMTYDVVIGKVIYVSADYYKIDLGNVQGLLPTMAFENASKKNRPELQKGDIVLCQVTQPGDELLLTCKYPGLGKIDEAHPIKSWKVRLLYFSDFLAHLGAKNQFKIAMGMNGFLWVDAEPKVKRSLLKALTEWEPIPLKNTAL